MKAKIITILTIIFIIISCSRNDDQLKSIAVPIWQDSDLNWHTPNVNMYQVFSERKAPYYSGSTPLSYQIGKSPGGVLFFYQFDGFMNMFVDPITAIKGARTRDLDNKIVAEAKLRYFSIKDPKSDSYIQGRELEEYHYNDKGDLIYYCKSTIDPDTGFKVKETDKIGKKERDYYFLWPVR